MVGILAVEATPHDGLSIVEISWPVRLLIAAALALGTGLSGWRVVQTLSVRMVRLDPLKSAIADGAASILMYTAALVMRVPVSLTFVLVSSILGTQYAGRKGQHARARYFLPMFGVWLLTIPAAALSALGLGGIVKAAAGI